MTRLKKVIYLIVFIIGVLGIVDTIALLTFTNINFGTLFPGLTGIVLIAFLYIKIIRFKGSPLIKNRILRSVLITIISLGVASFIILESLILIGTASDKNRKTDYLIILGAGLKGDTISLTLKERLSTGIEYLNKYPDTKVIVTGGQGFGEDITEAEAMKKYLLSAGISAERIITEDKATSTKENFEFSRKLIPLQGKVKVMIITSDFHMLRAKMLAERNGFEPYGIICSTPISVRFNSYIREYFALIKSFFLDM